MAEKRSIEKQLLLTGTLNTLLLADSSTTSITYKLVMLLIKRRKFLVKLSELILYKADVCFKRKKIGDKFEFFDLNTQENGEFILRFV